eukprot:m.135635 g.135635  ORF g.135635 m.135635 type:complete len:269 (-) comp10102_c0_seq1:171-977(-)
MGGGKSKERQPQQRQLVHSFNAVYLGAVQLPETAFPGVDACCQALDRINESLSEMVDAKVSLAISIYGIKALRTSFAGMKQDEASENVSGGISFEVIVNENIIHVAFCSDLNKHFCFISQDKETGAMRCFAFDCNSAKTSRKVARFTADACAKVFSTVNILKEALQVPILDEEENNGDEEGIAESKDKTSGKKGKKSSNKITDGKSAIDLLYFEGYIDADEQFQQEILELAGIESLPYQEPNLLGPSDPSLRTIIRQADPNEYERTRL